MKQKRPTDITLNKNSTVFSVQFKQNKQKFEFFLSGSVFEINKSGSRLAIQLTYGTYSSSLRTSQPDNKLARLFSSETTKYGKQSRLLTANLFIKSK